MKKSILPVLFLLLISACTPDQEAPKKRAKKVETMQVKEGGISEIIRNPITASGNIDTVNVARLVFEETYYDFGTLNAGEVASHVYKFSNQGKVPLILTNARSTCGCTVPSWPKEPIAPGESGEVKVRFDSAGKENRQNKEITISANTYPSDTKIRIMGNVLPKKK